MSLHPTPPRSTLRRYLSAAIGLGTFSLGAHKARSTPDCGQAPFKTIVAKTGSMRPTLQGGELLDVLPATLDDLHEGDVIVWRWAAKELNVIHRVRWIYRDHGHVWYVVTEGDNNGAPDFVHVTARELRGVVRSVPAKRHH